MIDNFPCIIYLRILYILCYHSTEMYERPIILILWLFCKDCEKKDSCPWERRKFAGKKNGFSSTIEKFFFKKTVSLCIKIPKIIVKFSAGRRGEKLVSFYGFVYTMKWDGIWLSHFGNIQNTRYRCRSRKTGLFAVGRRVCICFFEKRQPVGFLFHKKTAIIF